VISFLFLSLVLASLFSRRLVVEQTRRFAGSCGGEQNIFLLTILLPPSRRLKDHEQESDAAKVRSLGRPELSFPPPDKAIGRVAHFSSKSESAFLQDAGGSIPGGKGVGANRARPACLLGKADKRFRYFGCITMALVVWDDPIGDLNHPLGIWRTGKSTVADHQAGGHF
jgi:hypothetical protein